MTDDSAAPVFAQHLVAVGWPECAILPFIDLNRGDVISSVLQVASETGQKPGPSGCRGSGEMACLAGKLPPPGPAFYALGVETLTFLFTDIEGSTALLRAGGGRSLRAGAGRASCADPVGAGRARRPRDRYAGGCVLRGVLLAAGVRGGGAGNAAGLQGNAWPGGVRVRVRMGIHCGEAARTAAGLVGLEVHRAARVAAVAYGGQVLVSEAAAVLVRDGLPPGAALADLGVHRLKDLGRPEQIFQLTAAGLQAEFPPLRSLGNPALPNNLPAQLSALSAGTGRWPRSGPWWSLLAWSP